MSSSTTEVARNVARSDVVPLKSNVGFATRRAAERLLEEVDVRELVVAHRGRERRASAADAERAALSTAST